jgi:dTDP-D-glucose 4,6-dehydratase
MRGETVTIHGDRETVGTRYYMHSRNAADAMLFILTNTTPHLHVDGQMDRPDRYNIVGDEQISNTRLAELIAEYCDRPLAMAFEPFSTARPGHDRHYGLTGEKLARMGWHSPRTFEESMRETVWWQLDHPEWLE